jgi:hypothetical protein
MVGLTIALSLLPAVAPRAQQEAPRQIATVEGLKNPEALSFDAAHNVYLISNTTTHLGLKHGGGFIARISADGKLDSLHFIQDGRGGVTLNAPMGSRVRGDTLWVLDVDALRAFDTRTGAPLTTIDLSALHPLLLNDLAIGPNGDFYITDTGVHVGEDGTITHTGPDRIYHVPRTGPPTVALESSALTSPDGIDWDPRGRRYVLAPIGGTIVQTWRPGDKTPTNAAPGKGRFDGIEIEKDGSILITSWADSTVLALEGKRLVPQITTTVPPADISLDAAHHRIGIVSLVANRFELWTWPAGEPR